MPHYTRLAVPLLTLLLALPGVASAAPPAKNAPSPCSAQQGGFLKCDGPKFICKDGSQGRSDRLCGEYDLLNPNRDPRKTKPEPANRRPPARRTTQ
ncbi:MAG: hypothetical protein HQL96_00595 [Magnetococcales bacterium]|nr:hypothetical protein [Magnetococcales bacterium]